jgi:DNA-binding FadR family transcriptional regulator
MLSNEMTDRLQTTVIEHQKVYEAIAAHDPEGAEQAMKEHLAWSRNWIARGFSREMATQRLAAHQ